MGANMTSAWGQAFAKAWGDAWGAIEALPPAPTGDYIKWGYGPEIRPEKHEPVKTRLQLQNEALLMVLLH